MTIVKYLLNITVIITLGAVLTQAQSQEELFEEYNQLNQQLQQIQQQALADEEIASMSEELSNKIEAAMIKENPDLESDISRRNELVEEFDKSINSASEEELESIRNEYAEINQKIQPVQQQMIEKEEFLAQVQSIEQAMVDKMEEINPETPQLMKRLNELVAKLQSQQNQQ